MTTDRMGKAAERLRAMQDKAERRMSQILSGEIHGAKPAMTPPQLKPKHQPQPQQPQQQQQPQAAQHWISPQEAR